MPSPETVVCGLVIRPEEREVLAGGRELQLTAREFEIVRRLAEHPGWVFSADQLADGDGADSYSAESVSVHVARLRHKLALAGAEDAIETVRGLGYRLRSVAEEGPSGSEQTPGCRALRSAAWQLVEAVLEVDHSGSDTQRVAACEELERARHRIYAILSE